MKLDLTKLPDLASWGRRQVGKVNTGGAIFGAALVVVGFALVPQARESAAAIEPNVTRPPMTGVTAGIVSGDTLELNGRRVQLWGVTTPSPQTPQGAKAMTFLSAVAGTHRLVCLDTGHRSYDRIVARCMDPWGRDLAELMVRAGWAFDEAEYSRGQYAAAGTEAQLLGKGIFSAARPAVAQAVAEAPVSILPPDAAPGPHVVPRLLVGSPG